MTVTTVKQHKSKIRGHKALIEMKKVDDYYIITEIYFDNQNTPRLTAYVSNRSYLKAIELYNELIRYEYF